MKQCSILDQCCLSQILSSLNLSWLKSKSLHLRTLQLHVPGAGGRHSWWEPRCACPPQTWWPISQSVSLLGASLLHPRYPLLSSSCRALSWDWGLGDFSGFCRRSLCFCVSSRLCVSVDLCPQCLQLPILPTVQARKGRSVIITMTVRSRPTSRVTAVAWDFVATATSFFVSGKKGKNTAGNQLYEWMDGW